MACQAPRAERPRGRFGAEKSANPASTANRPSADPGGRRHDERDRGRGRPRQGQEKIGRARKAMTHRESRRRISTAFSMMRRRCDENSRWLVAGFANNREIATTGPPRHGNGGQASSLRRYFFTNFIRLDRCIQDLSVVGLFPFICSISTHGTDVSGRRNVRQHRRKAGP